MNKTYTIPTSFQTSLAWITGKTVETLSSLISLRSFFLLDEGLPPQTLKTFLEVIPSSHCLRVPSKEASKTFPHIMRCIEALEAADIHGGQPLVVIGGGAVLDSGAFVASLYRRGLPLILFPTTLLAMVDASIGGKTAINTQAKNQLGTFYPAQTIYLDLDFLQTLPAYRYQEGMAEIIKIALVLDATFVEDLSLKRLSTQHMIARAIDLKMRVVQEDLHDQGKRRLLNFGHTIGHAIEAASQYTLPHGRCVAEGMMLEVAHSPLASTIQALLHQYGCLSPIEYDKNQLASYVFRDKKRNQDTIDIIQLKTIGQGVIVKTTIETILQTWFPRRKI